MLQSTGARILPIWTSKLHSIDGSLPPSPINAWMYSRCTCIVCIVYNYIVYMYSMYSIQLHCIHAVHPPPTNHQFRVKGLGVKSTCQTYTQPPQMHWLSLYWWPLLHIMSHTLSWKWFHKFWMSKDVFEKFKCDLRVNWIVWWGHTIRSSQNPRSTRSLLSRVCSYLDSHNIVLTILTIFTESNIITLNKA